MRGNILRALFIVLSVLALMSACHAWDNRDPDAPYWYEFSPAWLFLILLFTALAVFAAWKRRGDR